MKIVLGERARERPDCAWQAALRIRRVQEIVDERIVAQELYANPPGGNRDGSGGTSLFDGFVDGREMNAASQRKSVFEDENAGCVFWMRISAVAAQEPFRSHQNFNREID